MNEMEIVRMFNSELSSIYEAKPPVSKAKMSSITRCAVKALKYYKHVVHSVEKFIQKCRPEYKVPGLYVIDSIVRQSRHQFGPDRDLFGPRFGKNIQTTFLCVYGCAPEEKPKVVRVLNLWQKNGVYPPEVIQPLIDMASEQALPLSKDDTTQAMMVSSSAAPHTPNRSSPPSVQDPVMTRIEQQRQQQEMQIQQLQQQLEQQKQQQLILEQQLQHQLAQQQQPHQQQYQLQDRHLQQQPKTQITAGRETGLQPPQLQIDPALFSQIQALTGQLQNLQQGQSVEETRNKLLGSMGTLLSAGRLPPNPVTDTQGHEPDIWPVAGNSAPNTSTSSRYDQGNLPTGATPQGKSPGFNKALLDAFDYGDEEDDEQRLAEQRRHLMEDEKRLSVRSSESPQNASVVFHRIQEQFRQQQHQSDENPASNGPGMESNGHHPGLVGAAASGERFVVGMGGQPPLGYPAPDGDRTDSHGTKEKFEIEGGVGQPLGGPAFVTTDSSRLEKMEFHRGREGALNDNVMLPRGPMIEGRHAFSQEVQYPEEKYKERLRGGPSENREEGLHTRRVGGPRGDVPFEGPRGEREGLSDKGVSGLPGERYPEHGLHHLPHERRFPGDRGGEPPFRELPDPGQSPPRESWLSRAQSKSEMGPDRERQEPRGEQRRKDDNFSERSFMTPEERKRQGYPPLRRNALSLCTITVWVGHLNKQTLQSQLKEVFETYGEVSSIDLVQARGCAFIVMKERKAAAAAIQHLRSKRINGHSVKLAWAPGKAIKGSEFKRYWDEDRGVTYIPWSKLEGVNLKEITDGAVIDPDSAPPGFSLDAEDESEKKGKEEAEELEEEGGKEQETPPVVLPPSGTSLPPFPSGIPPRIMPMPFHPGQMPPPPGIFPFPPGFRPPLPGIPPHLVPPPLGLRPDLVGITSHPMAGRLRGPTPSSWASEPGVISVMGESKKETEVDTTGEQAAVADGDFKEEVSGVSSRKEEGAMDQTPTDVDMLDESQTESKEGTQTQEVVAPPAPWMSMVRPPLTRPSGERWSGMPHGMSHPPVVRMMGRPPHAPFISVQPGPGLLPPGPRHVMESSLQRYPHGPPFAGPRAPIFPQRMPPIGMRGLWTPAEAGDDRYAASNEDPRFQLGGLQYRTGDDEENELGMRSVVSDKPPRRSKWDNGSVVENDVCGERSNEAEKGGDWELERDRERDSDRDRYSDRERDREREKDRERERERNRDREKDRDRERERDRGREREKDRERGRDRDRDSSHSKHKDRDGERDRERSRRERERGRHRDHDRERGRGRDKDRDPDRSGRRERERDRDRDPSREREKERRDRDRRRERDSDHDSRDESETTDTKGCSPAKKEDLAVEITEARVVGDKRSIGEERKEKKSGEEQPKFKRTRWEEVTIVPQKSVIETIEANKVEETCADERRDSAEGTQESSVQEEIQAGGNSDAATACTMQNERSNVVNSLLESGSPDQSQNLSEEKAMGLPPVVDEVAGERPNVDCQEKTVVQSITTVEIESERSAPSTPCPMEENSST